jgi:hypothetical protein
MNYEPSSVSNEMHVLKCMLHGAQIISDLLKHFFTLSHPVHRTLTISVNRCSYIVAHQNKNKIQ